MTVPHFFFAGGGTGGHLFPGLAVAAAIKQHDPDALVTFIGSERSLESDLVPRHGFAHLGLSAEPLTRLKRNPVAFFCRNWRAYQAAGALIRERRPTAVIGLGGFASAPVVLAAKRERIPIYLLEQNSIPGKSTRWLSRWAQAVCLSYPESARYFSNRTQTILTGNPLRSDIAQLLIPQQTDSQSATPTLLILGGSQGAKPLNEALIWLATQQTSAFANWRIVHQTGRAQEVEVRERYHKLRLNAEVASFLPDMAARYQSATIVISRAGATTLAELACAGVPSILVPYPLAAENHQELNARSFETAGAARIVIQGSSAEETGKSLWKSLQSLMCDVAVRQAMSAAMRGLSHPDATDKVLNVILNGCRSLTSRGPHR